MGDKNDILVTASRLKRDASMMLLVAECQKQVQQLALLSDLEKRAVASLVLAGQLAAIYSRSAEPDNEVLTGFERVLNSISPAMALRARSLSMHAIAGNEHAMSDAFAEISALTHDIGILIDSVAKAH